MEEKDKLLKKQAEQALAVADAIIPVWYNSHPMEKAANLLLVPLYLHNLAQKDFEYSAEVLPLCRLMLRFKEDHEAVLNDAQQSQIEFVRQWIDEFRQRSENEQSAILSTIMAYISPRAAGD